MGAGGRSRASGGWLTVAGREGDVVVSSRARLARNLAGYRFPNRAGPEERAAVLADLRRAILGAQPAGAGFPGRAQWVDLAAIGSLERTALVEEHLISQQHAVSRDGQPLQGRAVAIGLPERRLSAMVNEEDHLRLQVIRGGLDLEAALHEIDAADDAIERQVDYAYSPRFGYLTACPTNVGTGARLSVMLHLPALRMTREIEKVKRAADDLGLAVRGSAGEGSEAVGDFYQLSNQTTIGKSESVLLRELQGEIVPSVVAYERSARERLMKGGRRGLEDQAWRALGLLLHARLLSAEEATRLLSRVRLGVALGLLPGPSVPLIHQALVSSQPAHLQLAAGRELNQEQRREARASLLRSFLGKTLGGGARPTPPGGGRLVHPDDVGGPGESQGEGRGEGGDRGGPPSPPGGEQPGPRNTP